MSNSLVINQLLFSFLNILIAETLKTLGDCEDTIFSSCTLPDFPGNHTIDSLEACKFTAVLFRSKFRFCAEFLNKKQQKGVIAYKKSQRSVILIATSL